MSAAKYLKELESLGFCATWLSNTVLGLGDLVTAKEGRVRVAASLKDLGVPFRARPEAAPLELKYQSPKGIKFTFKHPREAAPEFGLERPHAGVVIDFAKRGYVLHAAGAVLRSLDALEELGAAVLASYTKGAWNLDHIVITEVVEAEHTTLLTAPGLGGRIVLRAEDDDENLFDEMSLAEGFVCSSARDAVDEEVSSPGLTPLYRAHKLELVDEKPVFQPVSADALIAAKTG